MVIAGPALARSSTMPSSPPSTSPSSVDLPLVVYLNQRYVFDLLAMAEGGLTQLETIKTSSAVQSDHASKISGDVGFSNVFAFIGLKGGGERSKSSLTSDQAESSIERVHTPNSL